MSPRRRDETGERESARAAQQKARERRARSATTRDESSARREWGSASSPRRALTCRARDARARARRRARAARDRVGPQVEHAAPVLAPVRVAHAAASHRAARTRRVLARLALQPLLRANEDLLERPPVRAQRVDDRGAAAAALERLDVGERERLRGVGVREAAAVDRAGACAAAASAPRARARPAAAPGAVRIRALGVAGAPSATSFEPWISNTAPYARRRARRPRSGSGPRGTSACARPRRSTARSPPS